MTLSRKYLWLGLAVLIILAVAGLSQWSRMTAGEQSVEAVMEKIVREAFAESHATAVANVGDAAFTAYVAGPLQETCPFYVPDGATYRQCLNDLVEREKTAYRAGEAAIRGHETYCESISEKYTGIEFANLYLSCLAYKLAS